MNTTIGRLMVITDGVQAARRGLLPTVTACLRGGADMVLYREKGRSDYARREEINDHLYITRPRGVALVVNDWFDLAIACGADGFQLGQKDMSVADARVIGGDCLIGCTVHSLAQARKAVADGADFLMAGPAFPTRDEHFPDAPGGLGLIRDLAAAGLTLPWFAAGGINEKNAAEVVAAGARRLAVCTALMTAADPAAVAAQLAALLAEK